MELGEMSDSSEGTTKSRFDQNNDWAESLDTEQSARTKRIRAAGTATGAPSHRMLFKMRACKRTNGTTIVAAKKNTEFEGTTHRKKT